MVMDMDVGLDFLLLSIAWQHVFLAPYAKVEESFNLHAVHDVLMYGVREKNLLKYDHFTFPGAVPRTFIGSILLAWTSSPILFIESYFGIAETKFDIQVISRLILATLNVIGLCLVRRAVAKRFGSFTGAYFTLLTCTQFHLPFWMGRTIPNTFALFLVNVSSYLLLNRRANARRISSTQASSAVSIITFAAVVFRGELALYLAPLCLQALLSRTISFTKLLKTGILAGLTSAALTIGVDSYFWQRRLLWPELYGIYFNVFEGKSAEWGVSPFHTYFTSHLPKLLLASGPLCIYGMLRNSEIRVFTLPAWVFVFLLSFLGHKEWRFIIYAVPIFNVAAAQGANSLFSRPRRGHIGLIIGALLICLNVVYTTFSTVVSSNNYPGGEAMRQFHELYNPQTHASPIHVHLSNLAAQTGASLFTQLYSPPPWPAHGVSASWVYNKTEGLSMADLTTEDSPFTHLILEEAPSEVTARSGWKVVRSVKAFQGIKVRPALIKTTLASIAQNPSLESVQGGLQTLLDVNMAERLWILERS